MSGDFGVVTLTKNAIYRVAAALEAAIGFDIVPERLR